MSLPNKCLSSEAYSVANKHANKHEHNDEKDIDKKEAILQLFQLKGIRT